MVDPYNTTFMDNSTGLTDVVIGVNNGLDGLFIPGILCIAWVIFFIAGRKNNDGLTSFIGSSFIIMFASILLYAAEIVTYHIIALPLVAFVGGIIAYFITNKN